MGLTDDLRTNLLASTDMDGTGEPANSEHHQQHNLVNAYCIAAEAAHGTTPLVLQTIYDNGTTSGDSIIDLDDTRDGLVLRDAATPITPTLLFACQTNGGTSIFEVDSDGITGTQALALSGGISSSAAGTDSERYGSGATAAGDDGLAVGKNATASGNQSTSVGVSSTATGIGASSFGQSADATADSATAIGKNALASAAAATALGEDASASQADATALGKGATVTAPSSIAIGSLASVSGIDATCIGAAAIVQQPRGIGIGKNVDVTVTTAEEESVAIGHASSSTGGTSLALATGATATGASSISIGASSQASASKSIAIGESVSVSGDRSIGIGDPTTSVTGDDSVSIGPGATASHDRAVALGDGAVTTADDDLVLGAASHNVKIPGDLDVDGTTTVDGLTSAGDITTDEANITAKKAALVLNTIWNTQSTDADGGRLGSYGYFGQTSLGGLHALANMAANHSGSSLDQRGRYMVGVNDGGDGLNPTPRLYIDWNGGVRHLIDTGATFDLEQLAGNAASFDVDALTADRAVTVPDRDIELGQESIFVHGGIRALAGSLTNQDGIPQTTAGQVIPYDGTCRKITAAADSLPGAGETCTITLWINGSATGSTMTLDNSNQTQNVTVSDSISAGDRVQLRATTNASWTTKDIDVAVYIQQER